MMLDMYEQSEYKMQIINKKKEKELQGNTHTSHTHTDKNHSNINNNIQNEI